MCILSMFSCRNIKISICWTEKWALEGLDKLCRFFTISAYMQNMQPLYGCTDSQAIFGLYISHIQQSSK